MGVKDFIKKNLFTNQSTKQTILKNTFWLFLAEGVNKGVMFLLTILIARYLGVEGYGKFSFAFAFVALFAVVADFGLSTLMIREVARNKKLVGKYVSNISFLKVVLGIITFALILIVAQFLGKGSDVQVLVYLAAIYTILNIFNDFFRAIFRAFQQMQYEAYSKVVNGVLMAMFIGTAIMLKLSINYIVIGYIISVILSLIFTLILVRNDFSKINFNYNRKFVREILKESWPFFISGMFVIIYLKVTTIMLSYFSGDKAVGWYTAAYTVVYSLQFLPVLILNASYPILSHSYIKDKKKFLNIYHNMLRFALFTIPLFIIIFLAATPIISLAYGKEYSNSVLVLQIMVWGEMFSFFSVIYLFVLNAINKQKLYTLTVFLSLLVNIILNIFLITKYTYIGAAISLAITELVAMILLLYLTNREVKKWNLQAKDAS